MMARRRLIDKYLVLTALILVGASLRSEWQSFPQPPLARTTSSFSPHQHLPAFVYLMKRTGMGSQIPNFFAQAVYFAEHENRTMMVDESIYRYRQNETSGLFTSYFTPTFPVIDTMAQQEAWIQPHMPDQRHNYSDWVKHGQRAWPNQPQAPILVTSLYAARTRIVAAYNVSSAAFFDKIVQQACPNLQFNAVTRQRISQLHQTHQLPDFGQGTTAAFHIRRGDKLRKESRLYEGAEYIRKLQQVAPTVFDHCFVATDDYRAVVEIQQASQGVCRRVWTLTHPDELGFTYRDKEETDATTLQFLAEISILVDATYFVGTFNSNVGALAAVMRKCQRMDADHVYGESYGVDQDTWYLRI